jgi:DNA-binding IclR family transcriptional regulator
VNPPRRAKRKIPMGYVERGHLIRELLRLLRALDVKMAMTVKEISDESGMELRQVYRWLKALEEENLIERFDRYPARYRLKPVASKLRRSIMK